MSKVLKWEAQRRYRKTHREQCRQRSLANYYKDRTRKLAKAKLWRKSLRGKKVLKKWWDKYKKSGKANVVQYNYYQRNKEAIKARKLTAYHANRKINLARMKKWRKSKDGKHYLKRYLETHPVQKHAHYELRNAVRKKIIRRQPCGVCGLRAEGHHPDYTKPLKVVWLCQKHHKELHRKLKKNLAK